jgi:adenosyl cobinamide kinase/adenosyl cobinamide phosphate guanylyltransferase
MLVLLLGGARCGKSALACALALRHGQPVTFLATATPADAEFERRIERHRASRPAGWTTVEEPLLVRDALSRIQAGETVIIDCLTLWVANLLARGLDEQASASAAEALAAEAVRRPGLVIAVSNEVGSGIVPESALARRFRDVLGRANAAASLAASEAYLVVAGRLLELRHPSDSRIAAAR